MEKITITEIKNLDMESLENLEIMQLELEDSKKPKTVEIAQKESINNSTQG